MTDFKKELLDKIDSKTAKVGIVGLGYVGLPLMLRFAESGFNVLGFDINPKVVEMLNAGNSYIQHIDSNEIKRAIDKNFFESTLDISRVPECDAIILCVPTPLNKYREPDLSFVLKTMDSLLPNLRQGQLMSLESTTYPGTTEEEIVTRIEDKGYKVGKDFYVVYSPEREDPGNPDFETSTIPKVCGGHTENCQEVAIALYSKAIDEVVSVSSTKVAEMTKLLENIQRAVNIGLVNEMKVVADKMGIDIFEVVDAASTKPFGFTPYYPGPGLGGHCIPIDPFYLTWKAREFGLHTRFIELSGEVNQAMPSYVVDKLVNALNTMGKPLHKSKVLVLGIAYKKNVDDTRESPSIEIMEILREKGADISYSDPHVKNFPEMRDHEFNLVSVELSGKSLKNYDAVILSTDHDKFDYKQIYENSNLIIDTRGKFKQKSLKIIKA